MSNLFRSAVWYGTSIHTHRGGVLSESAGAYQNRGGGDSTAGIGERLATRVTSLVLLII